ncbi:MAG TPA: Xaa-Pro peptidase family protein, partial [Candidatus Omnitrophota bacterium]|nr:Xaa-Pro peptidase family protein [Candidatus Omnitrophota bacterium]
MNIYIKNYIKILKNSGLDAFLITNDINIRYLTGFMSSDAWLLVVKGTLFYITDGRYIAQAQKNLKGIHVKEFKKTLIETAFDIMNAYQIRKVGFDSRHVTHFQYEILKEKSKSLKKISLVAHNGLIEGLRQIKSEEEIQKIKKSLEIHHKAYQYLKTLIKPGLSEQQIAFQLEHFLQKYNAGLAFSPIIASGVHTSYPHAKITARKMAKNDIILVDIGIDLNGYKSDLTRMFFLGRIPRLIKDSYEIVREVQQKAIEHIKEGVKACDIDKLARNYFKKYKLDHLFVHSLGHGVGLEVHETPRLSVKSTDILK